MGTADVCQMGSCSSYANEIFECLLIFVLSKEHEQVCSDGEGGGESRLGQDGDGAPVFHHQGCEQRSHLPNAKHFLQIQTKKVKSSLVVANI